MTPESHVLRSVGDYLNMKRYFFFRVNNTPVYDFKTKSVRSMPKHSMHGVSDFIMIHKGVCYFLEMKSASGKQSEGQIAFQKMAEKAGAQYHVIRSIDDLLAIGL